MVDDIRVEQRTKGEIQENRDRQENIRIGIEDVDDDDSDVEISQEQKKIADQLNKKVGKKSLRIQTEKVNSAIRFVTTNNIIEANNVIHAVSVWVAEQMGLKRFEINKRKEPGWKCRIEGDICQSFSET